MPNPISVSSHDARIIIQREIGGLFGEISSVLHTSLSTAAWDPEHISSLDNTLLPSWQLLIDFNKIYFLGVYKTHAPAPLKM